MARYDTLLEVELTDWDDGYGALQIVTPEGADEARLRFCYFNEDGRFTNRPLTMSPDETAVERTTEMVRKLGYVARTFEPDEIRDLVETLGEDRVVELAQLIDTLGEARLADVLEG